MWRLLRRYKTLLLRSIEEILEDAEEVVYVGDRLDEQWTRDKVAEEIVEVVSLRYKRRARRRSLRRCGR